MKKLFSAIIISVTPLAASQFLLARPPIDCPLRDAKFSIDSPLMDILGSPSAREVVESKGEIDLGRNLPSFFGPTAPSFSAIVTLREAGRFTRIEPSRLAAIDKSLSQLPIKAADQEARCARYDVDVPVFHLPPSRPRLLLFEKITGYKDEPAFNAAHSALIQMAERRGWAIATTDSAGAFNSRTLGSFDAVIWNNISGDVLTLNQRRAFQRWMINGGKFAGLHGTAGDPVYFWNWFPDTLIGARFAGHPDNPQFQDARLVVEDKTTPVSANLPSEWHMTEEWYSFKTNPRLSGSRILVTLDESTYVPERSGQNLRMGDHPIAWTRCVGHGRMFYSAIGHRPESYSDPNNVRLIEGAIDWLLQPSANC